MSKNQDVLDAVQRLKDAQAVIADDLVKLRDAFVSGGVTDEAIASLNSAIDQLQGLEAGPEDEASGDTDFDPENL